MSLWLVLPMKSLRDGKSRLAGSLNPEQRHELLEYLLWRTLERATEFPGLERTLLVSGCEETHRCAAKFGAQVVKESAGAGLNGALQQAQLELRHRQASCMLVVPCDLPLLSVQDVQHLAQAGSAQHVGVAPDRFRQGTNGLCLNVSLDFKFRFGPDSFTHHLNQVEQLGLQCVQVDRPGLAFDVDLPQDLAHLCRIEGEDHTAPSGWRI